MTVAARIVVVGLLGLGTGLGGGIYAGLHDDAWRPDGPRTAETVAGPAPAERGALADAARRAAAAEEQAAVAAARLRDVSDELAALRAERAAPQPAGSEPAGSEPAGRELRALEAEVEELRAALASARDAAERAALESARSTDGAVAHAERVAELEGLVSDRAAEVDAAEIGARAAAEALEAARAEAEALRVEAERARAALDDAAERTRALEALAAERGAALDAARAEAEALRREEREARAEAEEASARLAAAEAAAADRDAALEAAATERDDLLRLAASARVDALHDAVDELWPARPERVEAMRAWLASVEAELVDLDAHRAARDRVAARVASGAADDAAVWWADALSELVADLELFADRARGPVDGVAPAFGWGVARRAAFAESIVEASVTGASAREAWEEAARYAATESPYDGLELTPQVGLLPLGPDPASGLLEFAWLASGAAPARGPDDRLALDEASAAVLVLVPGGRDWLGAQATDRGGPNWDPLALDGEGPPREVRLAPYLIGKHELTQGQWLRWVGANPSRYGPGTWGGRAVDLAHPVTDVSWIDAREALARDGLRLPTEAEWEFAARAGADGPWWTGADARSLSGAVNLADRYAGEHGGASWPGRLEWLDDGHTVMARLDTYRANAFGLHHVHGNVWEWCFDGFGELPRAAGGALDQPLVDPGASLRRVVRGGAYNSNALEARASHRRPYAPTTAGAALGLRVARDLTAE